MKRYVPKLLSKAQHTSTVLASKYIMSAPVNMGKAPLRMKLTLFKIAMPFSDTSRSASILSRAGAKMPESTLKKKAEARSVMSTILLKPMATSVRSLASDKSIDVFDPARPSLPPKPP